MRLSSQPMRTIAVTGASGKTGRAVTAALRDAWNVRALGRHDAQGEALAACGYDVLVGDMTDRATLDALVDGVDAVYHICPNFHPDEVGIGTLLAEVTDGIERLVYHSVLHPQTEAMPHHWRKLRVEELLVARRRGRVTFLRPAPYVQNLTPYVEAALGGDTDGEIRLPYAVDSVTAMVDLADVGRAAATVLDDGFEHGSGWDLCGVAAIDHQTIAQKLSALGGRHVTAVEVSAPNPPADLQKMFQYMGAHGLPGSTAQLRALIGEPTPLETSLRRLIDAALPPDPTEPEDSATIGGTERAGGASA